MALPSTMNAVVFDGPYKISLQKRPIPQSKPADALTTDTPNTSRLTRDVTVRDGSDIIVKVNRTAVSNSLPGDASHYLRAGADSGAVARPLCCGPPSKAHPRVASCMLIEDARCPSRDILWATSSRVTWLKPEPMSRPSRSVTGSYRLSRRPGKL